MHYASYNLIRLLGDLLRLPATSDPGCSKYDIGGFFDMVSQHWWITNLVLTTQHSYKGELRTP